MVAPPLHSSCIMRLALLFFLGLSSGVAGLNLTFKMAFIWGPTRALGGQGYDLTIAEIQNKSSLKIAGETYTVESVLYVALNAEEASAAVENISKGIDQVGNQVGPFDAIVDAYFGGISTAIMKKGEEHGIVNVHCSGAHPLAYKEYPHGFGTMVDYTLYSSGPIQMGAIRGMKTISIIRGISTGFLRDMGMSALFWARESGYRVVGPTLAWCQQWQSKSKCSVVQDRCVCGAQEEMVSIGITGMTLDTAPTFYQVDELAVLENAGDLKKDTLSPAMIEYFRSVIEDIRSQGGDPEVLATWLYHHQSVSAALWTEEFTPALRVGWPLFPIGGMYGTNAMIDGAPVLNSTHLMYHVGCGQWHSAMKFVDPVFGSSTGFVEAYSKIYNKAPNYHVASCAAPPIAIITALVKYNQSISKLGIEERRQVIRRAVGELNVETLYGVIRFNRHNINIGRLTAAWQIVPKEGGGATTKAVLPESSAQAPLVVPAPLWGARQTCKSGSMNIATKEVQSDRDEYRTLVHAVRKMLNMSETQCTTCKSNQRMDVLPEALGICSPCALGHYRNDSMPDVKCVLCSAGTYADSTGLSMCKTCPVGSDQPNVGQWSCGCKQGFYRVTSSVGSWKCMACELHIPGSRTLGWESRSPDDCICPEGKFLYRSFENSSGKCQDCPEGLYCPGGNGPPLQAEGHWASEPDYSGGLPTLRLKCSTKKQCPKGLALGTCPFTHAGRACDRCGTDYYESEDGACHSCSDNFMVFPIVLAVLLVIAGLAGLVAFALRSTAVQNNTTMAVIVSSSITVNCVQVLAAFRELSIEWAEPMRTLQDILRVFSLRTEFLRPGCVFGINSPVLKYLGTLLTWLTFATILLIVFMLVRLAGAKIDRNKIVNAEGLVVMIFYLSLAVASILPFQCETNPDKTTSVQTMRSVLCGEGSHHGLVAMACIGCLVYIVSPLALVIWATISYPQKMLQADGIGFLKMFNFLFKRFTVERYYFGVVYFIRNTIIALVTAIFVNAPAAQVLVLLIWISSCGVVTTRLWPWRSEAANYLDSMNSIGLVAMLAGGALLMHEDSSSVVIQALLVTIMVLMFGVAFVLVSINVYLTWFPPKQYGVFLCHHKGGAAVLARLVKMRMQSRTSRKIFLDSDELDRLDLIFSICAYSTQNLVVLLTKETLSRSWCAGEITSAIRNGVRVIPVACNDYEPPSDDFLQNLHSLWPDSVKVELAGLGIEVEHIVEAYRTLRGITPVQLDRSASFPLQEAAIEEAIESCQGLSMMSLSLRNSLSHPTNNQIIIIGNVANAEAMTTCEVMRILLQRQLQVGVQVLSREASDASFVNCQYVVVMLTQGTLQNRDFAKMCVAALEQKTISNVVPVVADQFFEFPTPSFYASLEAGKEIVGADEVALPRQKYARMFEKSILARISEAYKALFNILALRFTAHGSEVIQKTEVKEMMPRFRDLNKEVDGSQSPGAEEDDELQNTELLKGPAHKAVTKEPFDMDPEAYKDAKVSETGDVHLKL